ncbi:unnamed protein product [Cylindrotheca closterium]|uniref:Uncharacterized protein n=1 Tax=Cylindrotheca closterium TaxID=2856 RepID=A0AAD2JMK5_9STRA|nr:unnamed protein product [Cylindrotheca closterium]
MQHNDPPQQSRKWQLVGFSALIAIFIAFNLKEAVILTAAHHIKRITDDMVNVPTASVPTGSSPAVIHHPQPMPKNGGALKLIIAKTIAAKDIAETLLDIQSFVERYSSQSSSSKFQIEWRLFCYKNETMAALLEYHSEDQWLQHYNTRIYLELGANKVNFWHKYLNPKATIDHDVDYIWMMDGDIQIRYMAWECFWDIVRRFQPSIFAPSLMTNMDSRAWEDRKVYVGSTHPHKCHVTDPNPKKKKKKKKKNDDKNKDTTKSIISPETKLPLVPRPVNNFQRMIAMDVWVVEIQLPVFSRLAWETTYNVFEERVQGWGQFKTSWAPDLFWCKMIDQELHGTNNSVQDRLQDRPFMRWQKLKKQCDINPKVMHDVTGIQDLRFYQDDEGDGDSKQQSHPCMLIHSTPVRDLDSRTIKLHTNKKSSLTFRRKGEADLLKYKQGLPGLYTTKALGQNQLYRAYISKNETEYNCQACRHTACLLD